MRNGKTPQEACWLTIERLISKNPKYKDDNGLLAGFIALNKASEIVACSYEKGLQYSLYTDGKNKVVDADHYK